MEKDMMEIIMQYMNQLMVAEKLKNILLMEKLNLKENILMEKEMEKEKNIVHSAY